MTTASNAQKPPKSKWSWIALAAIFAVAIVLFMTFRPVTDAETVVADDGEPKVYEPVVYDTSTWQVAPSRLTDEKQLMAILGSTASTEPALDYYGNQAMRYRFAAKHEVPLYVIDSDSIFELVWYYPAPTDDDKTKEQAITFAKRAYEFMSAVDGEVGTSIVSMMLVAEPVAPQAVASYHLLSAACQHYQCRIILAK